jgi:hypothetical protein
MHCTHPRAGGGAHSPSHFLCCVRSSLRWGTTLSLEDASNLYTLCKPGQVVSAALQAQGACAPQRGVAAAAERTCARNFAGAPPPAQFELHGVHISVGMTDLGLLLCCKDLRSSSSSSNNSSSNSAGTCTSSSKVAARSALSDTSNNSSKSNSSSSKITSNNSSSSSDDGTVQYLGLDCSAFVIAKSWVISRMLLLGMPVMDVLQVCQAAANYTI